MSGEMVPLLRSLQAGDEDGFVRLYAETNPLVLRYLRVVTDAAPAPLALETWKALLSTIGGFVADEDDDWFELAVGIAREQALEAAVLRSDVPTIAATGDAEPSASAADPGAAASIDPVGAGVATLRSCGSAVAEVLAIGVIAGLGRDSIARITGLQPSEVLALVLDGQAKLGVPPTSLMATMRAPGTPTEVEDLPAVLPIFDAQSHTSLPASAVASAGKLTVLELLPWDAPTTTPPSAVPHPGLAAVVPARWARWGAGAAAWTFAIGGMAAAAAVIEVVPGAIQGLFGRGGGPVVTAHGPIQAGEVPQAGGGRRGAPPLPGRQSGGQTPSGGVVRPGPTGPVQSGSGVAVPVSTAGVGAGTQVVVVSAVFTDASTSPASTSVPSAAASPSVPAATPSVSGPPTSGPSTSGPSTSSSGTSTVSSAAVTGTGHAKHSTGTAKGRTATVQPTAAQVKAAKVKAAKVKAAKAAQAAKAAKARAAAAKAKAAQARAAKA